MARSGAGRAMVMGPSVDYTALFEAAPSPYLVFGADLVVVEVNRAFLEATGRNREDLVGKYIFEAFPDNPVDPEAVGMRNLHASLRRVLRSGRPETMALQRHDIPLVAEPGTYEERWWSAVSTPILGPEGKVAYIIHRVEDVTGYVSAHSATRAEPGHDLLEAELYARAQELQRLNEELRRAHARARKIAVTLQRAMLDVPDLAHHKQDIAVRYVPAVGSMNVCGDWYDVADIEPGCLAVAVGDVIGHGLGAAAVMGMLRSALSAAVRALGRPAQALEALGLYARTVDAALGTTAFISIVDRKSRVISYSNAGHPPPILAHPDGRFELLDQGTDPPLGARLQHVPRPQATCEYKPGDTLVLYTDGLIERRGEDIDVGLARLTDTLTDHVQLGAEPLAGTLLASLGVAGGGRDDVALIVIRL